MAQRVRHVAISTACNLSVAFTLLAIPTAGGAHAASLGIAPDFGPNVTIFTPATPLSQIQATVDAVASQQVTSQFGPLRHAFLFMPGTYGSSTNPLNFQVGYYTTVAGLGQAPGDVVINGSIDVYNQCSGGSCTALDNFWRSLSNLTINVTRPSNNADPTNGCYAAEFWAVSQAAPLRRVAINGNATLMDYCTAPSYASGGFIADSAFTGGSIVSGSQQQWLTRNSAIDSWSNGVWNQVFSGVLGAPAQCYPAQSSCGGPYTTLPTSPVTREAPYLYTDSTGHDAVFVPSIQRDSAGATWSGSTATPGQSIPLARFFIASPSDPVQLINLALALGFDLILTPGIYDLDSPIVLPRPDVVVLGLGMPTLVAQNGTAAMTALGASGVEIEGVIVQAGPKVSPVLLRLGENSLASNPDDPSGLYDVFFRVGGAAPGSATKSLVVNSSNAILDDVWAWRADHGAGVGWTENIADNGVVVNGDDVTAYGLFVEHYQKYQVVWNGQRGTDIFFQNEMPYDPPSQAAWMEAPGVDGWAAFKVADGVHGFSGYGMGSYSNFDLGVDIFADHAFEVPTDLPPSSLNDLLTVFLSTTSSGGILHVINDTGGSATIANPSTPVTVVSYP